MCWTLLDVETVWPLTCCPRMYPCQFPWSPIQLLLLLDDLRHSGHITYTTETGRRDVVLTAEHCREQRVALSALMLCSLANIVDTAISHLCSVGLLAIICIVATLMCNNSCYSCCCCCCGWWWWWCYRYQHSEWCTKGVDSGLNRAQLLWRQKRRVKFNTVVVEEQSHRSYFFCFYAATHNTADQGATFPAADTTVMSLCAGDIASRRWTAQVNSYMNMLLCVRWL